MPFKKTPKKLIYDDLYWGTGNETYQCIVCSEYPPDEDAYWVKPPCCSQDRVICFFCFTNKKHRRENPFGAWNRRHQWCVCPLCNATVNLATDYVEKKVSSDQDN